MAPLLWPTSTLLWHLADRSENVDTDMDVGAEVTVGEAETVGLGVGAELIVGTTVGPEVVGAELIVGTVLGTEVGSGVGDVVSLRQISNPDHLLLLSLVNEMEVEGVTATPTGP